MPVNIRIIMENGGRASGEADVEFGSHEEAVKAMSKVRTMFRNFPRPLFKDVRD